MSDYPNSGILNRNKFKRTGSKAPDATGQGIITCKCGHETEFQIAGWMHDKNGKKFTALRFEEKGAAEKRKAEAIAKKSGLPIEGATHPETPETKTEQNIPF